MRFKERSRLLNSKKLFYWYIKFGRLRHDYKGDGVGWL